MFIANDLTGNRISIDEADVNLKYFCPICEQELIQRRGNKNLPHFAHMKYSECDSWNYDMSEWHRNWQSKFPLINREVVVSYNGEKHRADILINNTVIEFQHSRMTSEEFWERNNFYVKAGYEIVWLFDLTEVYELHRIQSYRREFMYKWKYHWSTFWGFDPAEKMKVRVYFQFLGDLSDDNCGIEHLTWLSPDQKFFSTEFGVAYDEKEFLELFNNKQEDNHKQEVMIVQNKSEIKATTLLEILRNSNSDYVVAENINTGYRVKIKNSDYYKNNRPYKIYGFIGTSVKYKFYNDSKEIYNWDKAEWILEWES